MKNDLFWEHKLHSFGELPKQCSSCFNESEEVKLEEVQEDYEIIREDPTGPEYDTGPNDL